jgi:hypothetical protein
MPIEGKCSYHTLVLHTEEEELARILRTEGVEATDLLRAEIGGIVPE